MLSLTTNPHQCGGNGPALPVEGATEKRTARVDRLDPLNSRGSSLSDARIAGGDQILPVVASTPFLTRPAFMAVSGGKPSIPSFADGGAKTSSGGSRRSGRVPSAESAKAKQAAPVSQPIASSQADRPLSSAGANAASIFLHTRKG